VAAKKYKVQI